MVANGGSIPIWSWEGSWESHVGIRPRAEGNRGFITPSYAPAGAMITRQALASPTGF